MSTAVADPGSKSRKEGLPGQGACGQVVCAHPSVRSRRCVRPVGCRREGGGGGTGRSESEWDELPACEQRIQIALTRIDGVAQSAADHQAARVRVMFDPARTSEAAVRSCIERAGYVVAP